MVEAAIYTHVFTAAALWSVHQLLLVLDPRSICVENRFDSVTNVPPEWRRWRKELSWKYHLSPFMYVLLGVALAVPGDGTGVFGGPPLVSEPVRLAVGGMLVLQGYISWWSDASCFGVDSVAHAVDRTMAPCTTVVSAVLLLAGALEWQARCFFVASCFTSFIFFGLSQGMLKDGGRKKALFDEFQWWHTWWHCSLPLGAAGALSVNALISGSKGL